MITHVALMSLVALFAVDPPREPQSGAAGTAQPAARKLLAIGDMAPPISTDYWVKGDELAEFESGKSYVVEFWATWSPPCRKSLPHISELARKYPSIRIVGVASMEHVPEKDREDMRLKTVMNFVKEKGDEIAYTVAYDGDETMNVTWKDPAGQSGIPVAFVIDGRGRVAWIGHPMQGLDDVLAKVAAGTYDVEKVKQLIELKKKANTMLELGQFEQSLTVLDDMYRLDPSNTAALTMKFNTLLMKIKNNARASAAGNSYVDGPLKNSPGELEQIMRSIVLTPGLEQRDFALAIRAGERAQVVSGKPSSATLEVLAKAHRGAGDFSKAIATLQKAVDASEGTFKEVLTDTLNAWKQEAQAK